MKIGPDLEEMQNLKLYLAKELDKELKRLKCFLGIEVARLERGLCLFLAESKSLISY